MKNKLLWKARREHTMRLTTAIFAIILASTVTITSAQCINLGTTDGPNGSTMNPTSVPQFVNVLPVIRDLGLRIDATAGGNYNMKMDETTQDLLGMGLQTKVWGYGPANGVVTYPGPTFVTMRDVPITTVFENKLDGHFLPVDPSLHMAHPAKIHGTTAVARWYADGNVPTVPHLHGGHTKSASDGLPEAWYTQGFSNVGAQFVKQKLTYHNDQEAGTLWYHDHALGITRLNVYAGLAGFYLLRDANENNLVATNVLPADPYEIEVVIQDRLFDTNGQLFWPAYPGETPWDDFIDENAFPNGTPDGVPPSALAEFFGNIILVNGKAWPKLNVEPRKYRFRLLNGSDSRFYILKLDNGADMMIIGTDDGLLETPVSVNEFVFAPGERYDVIIDFSSAAGSNIIMTNWGPDSPYGGQPVDPADLSCSETTGKIMRFDVNLPLNAAIPDASVGMATTLRPVIQPLVPAAGVPVRKLVLFEGMDEYGRLQPMLGTMQEGSQTWSEPITENPMLNSVEEWEVYNATGDAHPIHLHLVAFQIKDRQRFTPVNVLDLDPMKEIVSNEYA